MKTMQRKTSNAAVDADSEHQTLSRRYPGDSAIFDATKTFDCFARMLNELRLCSGKGSLGKGYYPNMRWRLWNALRKRRGIKRCAREAASSNVDQPALGRQYHGLRAANGVELFQNSRHVIFHGVLADVEHLSNFLIAFAKGHLLQHLKFALG